MQFLNAMANQKLNAAPHREIVGAKLLKTFVRRGVLIERISTEVKKDCRGNCPGPESHEHGKAVPIFDKLFVDVEEK
jgi:hypothetical protein